jgi:hypothetical protein
MPLSSLTPRSYRNVISKIKADLELVRVRGRVAEPEDLSGGLQVTTATHHYHVFTSSGTFTASGGYKTVELLMVGGGGAGWWGGGGCAQIVHDTFVLPLGEISVVIGAGGATDSTPTPYDREGNITSLQYGDDNTVLIYAGGGGAGATASSNTLYRATTGHGGGGGGSHSLNSLNCRPGAAGTKTVYDTYGAVVRYGQYGFSGGTTSGDGLRGNIVSAGGGGASAVGSNVNSGHGAGASGGAGTADFNSWLQDISSVASIGEDDGTGTLYICGGGGGNGYNKGNRAGGGGLGGGGNGASPGDANTGGGGGGGATGGSGFVIIRYAV